MKAVTSQMTRISLGLPLISDAASATYSSAKLRVRYSGMMQCSDDTCNLICYAGKMNLNCDTIYIHVRLSITFEGMVRNRKLGKVVSH